MDANGHKQIAKLVNYSLTNPFLTPQLLQGAVDPDTKESGINYTGNYSKHHYDNRRKRGRYHGSDVISNIVVEQCLNARKYWLADDKTKASFFFGIITHYFMDGLIISPSVDEQKHGYGDRIFARKAEKSFPQPIDRLDEMHFGKVWIKQQLENIPFGSTDIAYMDVAIKTLTHLAVAVTAATMPKNMIEYCDRIHEVLCADLTKTMESFQTAEQTLKKEYPKNLIRELDSHIEKGKWYQVGRALLEELEMPDNLPTFLKNIVDRADLSVLHELAGYEGRVQNQMEQALNHVRPNDESWYESSALKEQYKKHERRCQNMVAKNISSLKSVKSRWQHNCMPNEVRRKCLQWLELGFLRNWDISFRGKLAKSKSVYAIMIVGIIALLLMLPLVLWISSWLVAAIPVLLVSLLLCSMLKVRSYKRIHHHISSFYKRSYVRCPRCWISEFVEYLPTEQTMVCPHCGGEIVLPQNGMVSTLDQA